MSVLLTNFCPRDIQFHGPDFVHTWGRSDVFLRVATHLHPGTPHEESGHSFETVRYKTQLEIVESETYDVIEGASFVMPDKILVDKEVAEFLAGEDALDNVEVYAPSEFPSHFRSRTPAMYATSMLIRYR